MTTSQIMYVLAKAAQREGTYLIAGGLLASETFSLRWGDLEGVGERAVEAIHDLFAVALKAGALTPDDFLGYKKLTVYRVTPSFSCLTKPWLQVLKTSDYERVSYPYPDQPAAVTSPYVREFVIAFKGSRSTAVGIVEGLA